MFYGKAILKEKDFCKIGYDWAIKYGYTPTRKDKRFRIKGGDNKVNQNVKMEMRINRNKLKKLTYRMSPHTIKITLANRWNWD